jgi:transcriptional antiterminator NusG
MAYTDNNTTFETFLFDDNIPRWYVVQTYVGFEDAVKKSLTLKINNLEYQNRILELYIPTKTVFKLNAKGEKKEKIQKIYPGYIYMHCVLDKEVGYLVQNTPYVSKIVGTGQYAVPVEVGYIEKLKTKLALEQDTYTAKASAQYFLGDLIVVISGPFKDMSGKICGLDGNKVTVLLTMFDRETKVDLDILEISHKF